MHAYQHNHTQIAIKILSGERLPSDNAIIKIRSHKLPSKSYQECGCYLITNTQIAIKIQKHYAVLW